VKKFFGMKITPAHSVIAVICFALALIISLQIKSVYQTFGNTAQNKTMDTLAQELVDEKNKNEGLMQQAQDYQNQINKYEAEIASDSSSSQAVVDKLHQTEIAAGTVAVSGPGVIVHLNDAASVPDGASVTNYIIHDVDLLRLINELKNAGAEAISINGERLIATSDIRCVGNNILINKQTKTPPFEIDAIGDSSVLYTGISMSGGILDVLKLYLDVSCDKTDNITIPAYGYPLNFKFAVAADTTNN